MQPYSSAQLPLPQGLFEIYVFKDDKGMEHVALAKGDINNAQSPIPLRIHSECLTGDVFHSLKCDCGAQLHGALDYLGKQELGLLLYLRQEGRGIGLGEKIKAYALQQKGLDTVEANLELGFGEDDRDYRIVGEMLKYFGLTDVKLITNNPLKIKALESINIRVLERLPSITPVNKLNRGYLTVKKLKLNHHLPLN